jgi:hypothetical protein
MALLKPSFLRAHPVQSGMIWAAGFAPLFLLLIWVTGILPVRPVLVGFLIVCSAAGGLGWGYAMKAYHDRAGSRG